MNVKSKIPLIAIIAVALTVVGTMAYLSTMRSASWSVTVSTGDLTITPDTFDFGTMFPGEGKVKEITVSNIGNLDLTISFNASGASVSWTLPEAFVLAPGANSTKSFTMTVDSDYSTSGGSLSGLLEVRGEQIP